MREYTFDFRQIPDLNAFYQQCRQQWLLPEWFGDNLDALWDALTSGEVPLPATLHLMHLCERDDAEQFDDLITLLHEAQIELDGALNVQIA